MHATGAASIGCGAVPGVLNRSVLGDLLVASSRVVLWVWIWRDLEVSGGEAVGRAI